MIKNLRVRTNLGIAYLNRLRCLFNFRTDTVDVETGNQLSDRRDGKMIDNKHKHRSSRFLPTNCIYQSIPANTIMSGSITITYNLSPPSGVAAEGLSSSSALRFPVPAAKDSQKSFYGSLHDAIKVAKDAIGDDLTKWRDAVGKAEATKEPKGKMGDEADEEEGDLEEEV